MVAALDGCGMSLVVTGWTISHLVSTNGCRKYSSSCKGTISGTVGSFRSRGVLAGRRALAIESLLMTQALTNYSSNISVTYKLWLLNSNLRGICHRLLAPQIIWQPILASFPGPAQLFIRMRGYPHTTFLWDMESPQEIQNPLPIPSPAILHPGC